VCERDPGLPRRAVAGGGDSHLLPPTDLGYCRNGNGLRPCSSSGTCFSRLGLQLWHERFIFARTVIHGVDFPGSESVVDPGHSPPFLAVVTEPRLTGAARESLSRGTIRGVTISFARRPGQGASGGNRHRVTS
jgi:hypothetical protein